MILLSSHQFPVILILLNGITLNPVTHHSFSPLILIFDASPNIANIISYILNLFTWFHSYHNHPSQSLSWFIKIVSKLLAAMSALFLSPSFSLQCN